MEYDAGISMSQPYDEDTLWQMNLRSSETMELGPYPVREGEPDCSYYIRTGLCRFGATCRFNHPPNRKLAIATARMKGEYPERIGQPECQYYLKTGTCKFGATCKFHHPRDKAGIAGRVPVNVLGYPLRPNETECAYYLRTGQCKFGSTCKFHHPPPSNMMVSLRGSPVYPSAHSPTTADQQSYPGGIANWPLSRASFIPSPRWQGPSSYGPMILPQGVVSVPGWNAYSGQLSSMSSPESQQQTAGNSIYGNSRQSEAANAGSQGTLSPYRSGSVPVGYYALQRENVFPERPGQPECQFYMKTGDCKFGAVCRFHHPRERLIPAPDCVLSPIGLPLRPISIRENLDKVIFQLKHYPLLEFKYLCHGGHDVFCSIMVDDWKIKRVDEGEKTIKWCVMCTRNLESADHLFLHCPVALLLWHRLFGPCNDQWVAPKECTNMLLVRLEGFGGNKRAKSLLSCIVFAIF